MAFQADYRGALNKGEITLKRAKSGVLMGDMLTDHQWLSLLLGVTTIRTCAQCDELLAKASEYGLGICYLDDCTPPDFKA